MSVTGQSSMLPVASAPRASVSPLEVMQLPAQIFLPRQLIARAPRQPGVIFRFRSPSQTCGEHMLTTRASSTSFCVPTILCLILSDEEISTALGQFLLCTKPGGLVILSVRDYATLERGGTQIKPYGVRYDGAVRYVLFQVWDWRDSFYDLTFYVIRDGGTTECHIDVARSTYYAISISEITHLMEKAGFIGVRRIDNVFFQPLIVGIRPRETNPARIS